MTMMDDAIWVAKTLFERGKVTGSAANLSFIRDGMMYITRSGSCFGRLTADDFSVLDSANTVISGQKPSKEWPLHRIIYDLKADARCVLHTHSLYAVLWSLRKHPEPTDIIPPVTPYLRMRVGRVGLVDYAQPGSEALFSLFREAVPKSEAYILKRHGVVVAKHDLLEAFYDLEELEESARIAWELFRL